MQTKTLHPTIIIFLLDLMCVQKLYKAVFTSNITMKKIRFCIKFKVVAPFYLF